MRAFKVNMAMARFGLLLFAGLVVWIVMMRPLSYFTARPGLGSFFSMLVADGGVSVERGLAYGPAERQKLDIYRSKSTDERAPILFFVYGGGWTSGDKETYGFVGAALAARGYTTVIADYRLYPQVKYPVFNEDVARAYAFAFERLARGAGGAGDRPVVLMGHSAGAHIAALLALDGRYRAANGDTPPPAGLIGLAGPYAFFPTKWHTTKEIFDTAESEDEPRPIAYVEGRQPPPMLLLHGLADDVVKLWNLRDMRTALRAAGGHVCARELPKLDHKGAVLALARPFRSHSGVHGRVLDFLAGFEPGGALSC